jgi:hypothetical protein
VPVCAGNIEVQLVRESGPRRGWPAYKPPVAAGLKSRGGLHRHWRERQRKQKQQIASQRISSTAENSIAEIKIVKVGTVLCSPTHNIYVMRHNVNGSEMMPLRQTFPLPLNRRSNHR